MPRQSVFEMKFSKVYPLLVKKVERKGRTKAEADEVIWAFTGYGPEEWDQDADYTEFFESAPKISEELMKVTGTICGVRIAEIDDPVMKKIRILDKLIDELAKGKSLDKIIDR